jgi:hypothetical protein
MALTSKQKTHLNNMNRAADDVSLGTVINDLIASGSNTGTLSTTVTALSASATTAANQLAGLPSHIIAGSYTVQNADLVGSASIILGGFTGIKGFMVQDYRSGSQISGSSIVKVGISISGSNLVINSGSTLSGSTLALNDILNYILF